MPTRPDTLNLTVTTAGTAVPFVAGGSEIIVEEAWFRPNVGTTGIIYLGAEDVSSTNGYPFQDGDSLKLANKDGSPIDLSLYYIDASVNGEGGVVFFHRED